MVAEGPRRRRAPEGAFRRFWSFWTSLTHFLPEVRECITIANVGIVSFEKKPAAPERISHTPLVAAKYNRQNRTENPLEMGGEGGDGAAWGELGDRGGNEGATWAFSKEEFYTGRAPSAKG
jgi:hypothetical protein